MGPRIHKEVKFTKTSTNKRKPPKEQAPIKTYRQEMYTDMFTLRQTPISDDYLEKFALEWITVTLNDDDMLTLNDFYFKKGVNKGTVEGWIQRSPIVREAHDYVVNILGNRRERGSIKKQYDSTTILRSQHMYDKAWQASEEWRANLQAKISGAGGNILVEMQAFPSSDLVPKKRSEKVEE